MSSIPANELKTRGVSAIEQALADSSEAIVSVRGKDKYVVMSFEQYSHLRTCELEAGIHEARAYMAAGRYVRESAVDHLNRASKWLRKHSALRDQYLKTLQLMELNINHPSLRLHKLTGSLNGLSSVSINMSYRITLEPIIQDKDIIMINIGSQDEVYK